MGSHVPLKARLRTLELLTVRHCTRSAGTDPGRFAAIAVSKLGNGWLYPVLGVGLLALAGERAWPVILAAGVSILFAQSVLGALKRWHKRTRPYANNREFESLLAVQDPNSFPSGHMMTLTAAFVPALLVFPGVVVWLIGPAWALMAWSRMACAHHYPSDVLAGTALGLAIAGPISALIVNAPLPWA